MTVLIYVNNYAIDKHAIALVKILLAGEVDVNAVSKKWRYGIKHNNTKINVRRKKL